MFPSARLADFPPFSGYTPDSSCAAHWLTYCLSECSICTVNNDWWTFRVVCEVSCQSLVPFCARVGGIWTWPALWMGSVLFLGLVFIKMVTAFWELAPSITWELRAGILPGRFTDGSRGSDTLRSALQKSRFFSLALDVKFSSHSFLLARSFWSGLHFITTAAVETQLWLLWWFDESANVSQSQKNVSRGRFYLY